MDALEFLREHKRMCNRYEGCCDCPLEVSICPGSSTMPDEDYKKLITVVEKWSAEHPRKTRQSVLLEQYPEVRVDDKGVLCLCPATIPLSYRKDGPGCINIHGTCYDCRHEFWMQEVE